MLTAVFGWGFSIPALRDGSWIGNIIWILLVLVDDILAKLRRGESGIDILALLTMSGVLLLGEFLTGAIIVFMLVSVRTLEEYANRRERNELSTLLANAPHKVHRYRTGILETVNIGNGLMVTEYWLGRVESYL